MKTTRIQFNATTFKATRDTIGAYFGAKFELAETLDSVRKATKSLSDVIATDRAQLTALAMGETEVNGAKIVRTMDDIRKSLETNTANYNKQIAPYNVLVEKTSDAILKAVALFNNKESVLYKAYVAYATDTTDDNYNAYAKAMADRFVELGLADATADNVVHFMPNADRELKGKTAVKNGDIQGALNANAFSNAVLRKIYVANKTSFSSDKFVAYVKKCADKAKNAK